jgi:predicted HTH transcriptional regulator
VIHAIGRFEETPEELTIDLTPDGYVSMGATANVAQAEAERVLLAALAETEAMSLNELVKVGGVTRTTAYRTLKNLCVRGSVQATGTKRNLRYSLRGQSGPGEAD